MSVQAIAWVLEGAPGVKPHWVSTLMGLANHAGEDGYGSYPSVPTLARYTRKSERAVRRDLEEMEEVKLIEKGDQRMVLHIPADRRPTVWNLRMDRVRDARPAPKRPGRPKKAQVSAPVENGVQSASPRFSEEIGVTHTTNRGDAHDKSGGSVRQNGVTHTPPKPSLNRPGTVQEPPPGGQAGHVAG